jgi:hypothetical protein
MTCKRHENMSPPLAFISFSNNLKMHVLIEFTMTWLGVGNVFKITLQSIMA